LKQLHPEHTDAELAEIKRQIKAGLPPFHPDTSAGLVPNIISGRIASWNESTAIPPSGCRDRKRST
jgi:hypothetical protein